MKSKSKQQKKNQNVYSRVLLVMAFLAAVLTVIFTELRWDYAAFSASISALVLAVLAVLAGIFALIDVTLGERNREKIAELEEEMEACPARLVKIEDLSPGGSFDPAAAIEEHERRAWRRVEENDRRRIEREKAERER